MHDFPDDIDIKKKLGVQLLIGGMNRQAEPIFEDVSQLCINSGVISKWLETNLHGPFFSKYFLKLSEILASKENPCISHSLVMRNFTDTVEHVPVGKYWWKHELL